jgi:hypothetical protein
MQPGKIKAERCATPQIIEPGLGEVLCVFYNPRTNQFWTSHKTNCIILLWSSNGIKEREIKCACCNNPSSLLTKFFAILEPTFLTRLQLAHPVTCFCKVGEEQVWAGTFDSIIMFSNEGERLHSTSTGAGRMAFIRQGGASYASCACALVNALLTLLLPFAVMSGPVAVSRPATYLLHHPFFNGPSHTLQVDSIPNWTIHYTSSA